MTDGKIAGPRYTIDRGDPLFPEALKVIPNPPDRLRLIGNPEALAEGLAIVGARNATPYGIGCAKRFATIAARRGITIISGGARGCDSAAHAAALDAGGKTVVFFGGGCDHVYPERNRALFQRVVDAGGAIVSEYDWSCHPEPYMFRMRNRLIAGLSRASLIVEAGLPSGTFSTADEALAAGKEVWAVPGAITSSKSAGANYLIAQGATPIIDDDSFLEALFLQFGCMRYPGEGNAETVPEKALESLPDGFRPVVEALMAQPMRLEDMVAVACGSRGNAEKGSLRAEVMEGIAMAEADGIILKTADGRYMAAVPLPNGRVLC